jgi:hypothetical protein
MNHTILRIKMNLRGFREEIWKGWSVFLIILAEGIIGIKREILVGAESAKNSTCVRLHSRGRGRAQADSPQGQPATPGNL